MKSLYAIVCLMCFALPTISYTQISVNDLIEDVKKERGDATDSGKDAANTKAMEDFIGDMAKTVNTVTNLPLEQRCLELMHAHHKKLLESNALIDKAGSNCLRKKDALELHSLAVLSAGTQIYCPDEFNSDKIEYAILILYELVKEHCFNTENERVIAFFQDLEYLSEKVGNPYGEASFIPHFIKNGCHALQNGSNPSDLNNFDYSDLDDFMKKVHESTDSDWEKTKLSSYITFIDYINYFHSPDFMLTRADEIEGELKALPCR